MPDNINRHSSQNYSPSVPTNKISLSKEEPNPNEERIYLSLIFVDDTPNRRFRPYYETYFLDEIDDIVFTNAKQGEFYRFQYKFKDSQKMGYESLGLVIEENKVPERPGFESLGLKCRINGHELWVEGTPNRAFDGKVVITTKLYYSKKSETTSVKQFSKSFYVLPDPYSLWKDLSTPQDAPYRTEDIDVRSAQLALKTPITILAASQRGRSHAHEGKFRDDCFDFRLASDKYGWHTFAVADGAGSARFSREGSRIACKRFVSDLSAYLNSENGKIITEKLKDKIHSPECQSLIAKQSIEESSSYIESIGLAGEFHKYIYSIGEAIQSESKRYSSLHSDAPTKMHDYATTGLFLAAKRFTKDNSPQNIPTWAIISYWVGDGGLAIYRPNQNNDVVLLGEPDCGEFAGQTRFLTMREELETKTIDRRLRLTFVRNFRAIVMATDGITDPFFPSESSLKDVEKWNAFWNETIPKEFPGVLDYPLKTPEKRAEALLKGMMFKVPGNHDDRTLLMLVNDKNYDL